MRFADGAFEGDTCLHSWEVLGKILSSKEATGILCDIGMQVVIIIIVIYIHLS